MYAIGSSSGPNACCRSALGTISARPRWRSSFDLVPTWSAPSATRTRVRPRRTRASTATGTQSA